MSSTDQHPELPAPHFEDRLWTVLAEAHGQRDLSTAGPHRPGRSPVRRGRRLLTAGIGTVAAAAAVIATISVVSSGSDHVSTADRTAPERASEAPAEVDLAAEITAATEEAVADSVVYIVEDSSDDHVDGTEQWSDEASGVWRTLGYYDGAPSLDSGVAAPPAVDAVAPPPLHDDESCAPAPWASQTGEPSELPEVEVLPDCQPTFPPDHPMVLNRSVDYCFDQYAEFEVPALPARNEAEFVGEQLASGELIEDGTEVIDGQELIRLRSPGEWSEHTYYVDPETYRPVRSEGYPDDAGVPLYVRSYEYLPRTPENLASLVAPVPEGFVQVDAGDLRGDGARFEAGCGY